MQATCDAFVEIDMATASAFLAAMCEMIDWADNRAVIIDCSAITFMDSSAFHALMDAHAYAIDHDHALVIRGLAKNCARVARLCDDGNVLTIEP
jgi:anti-anti-sigma factor